MDSNMEHSMNDSNADDDACCRGHGERQTGAGIEGVPQIIPPPDGVHSNCDTCEENYYTVQAQQKAISLHRPGNKFCAVYEGPYTDTKAQDMMDYAVEQTTKALEQIKEDLTLYGDLILARWTKKTKDKRGRLLSSAANVCFGPWPSAETREFAEKVGNDALKSQLRKGEPMINNALLGSGLAGAWVNIEDFAGDRMKLFSLLYSRTRYPPRDWALFDAREMSRFFFRPATPLGYNPNCVMMTGKAYGRLVPFDLDLIHSGVAVGFPRACATAYVQLALAGGLRHIVRGIVAEATPSGNSKWVKLVSDGLHSSVHRAR